MKTPPFFFSPLLGLILLRTATARKLSNVIRAIAERVSLRISGMNGKEG
jgi:hypothetical protein